MVNAYLEEKRRGFCASCGSRARKLEAECFTCEEPMCLDCITDSGSCTHIGCDEDYGDKCCPDNPYGDHSGTDTEHPGFTEEMEWW